MAAAVPSTNVISFQQLDAESPVTIPDGHPMVVLTPFLPWSPMPAAGAARTGLPQCVAVRVFLRRSSTGPRPDDKAASRNARPLRIRLTDAAWTRVLDELVRSGLLTAGTPFTSESDLEQALDALFE